MEKTYCVYIHTNKANGKRYVGMTSLKPEQRWQNGQGYAFNDHFYNEIIKYGWDNFTHEIAADNLTKTEARIKEIELIQEYKTQDKELGYNINCYKPYQPRVKEKLYHCIELDMTFKTLTTASEVTGADLSTISRACKGQRKSAGKHPETNEPLHWEYVDVQQ